ncbi:MAG TPA: PAS domain S-box protein, partial [Chloroflexota bacterium]|nr:PAS domain S-box protein [Chloroflexota bacterium]
MEGPADAPRHLPALSELSREATRTRDISALLARAVSVVAATLDTEYAIILQLLSDGKALRPRAGTGWQEDLIRAATFDAGLDFPAGYALLTNRPVVVEDLLTEPRFHSTPLLVEHSVISGIITAIPGLARPWGVLGTYSTRPRRFGEDDVQFFQTVASILGLALERTRADEARVRATAVVEVSPDAVIELTLDGTITRWNRGAERLYGYTPPEVIGRPLTILFPAERAHEVPAALERVRQGEYGDQSETRQIRREGHLIDVEVRMVPARDDAGQVVGATMIVRDLTEQNQIRAREHAARIRAEVADALRKNEERLRTLVESIEDYTILMLDPQGYLIGSSTGGEWDTGYPETNAPATHISSFYPPEDIARGAPAEELRRAAAEGRVEVEGWRVRPDGSRFWAGVVTTTLKDPEGRLSGFVQIVRDLTYFKLAEDALLTANADLQDAVRTRDALLRSIGDDLRQPLATIQDRTQRMRAEVVKSAGADDEVLADGLAAIETLAIRLRNRLESLTQGSPERTGPPDLQGPEELTEEPGEPSAVGPALPANESDSEYLDHRPDEELAPSGQRSLLSWLEGERAQFLRTIPVFRALPHDALRVLASVAQP